MRGFRYFLSVLFFSLFLAPVAPVTHAQQQVTLGNATAELTGPWKFHIGDSPQANGRRGDPRWAQPDYDDSAWGAMDLTPPPGSYDPVIGSSGFVPGWTARGYKGYSGYAWYRLRVNVQDGQSALALKMPDNFDDAYQVYVNGQLVGEFGRFTARGVTAYASQPQAFSLPANLHGGPETIAVRMWMAPSTPLVAPDAGGLHGPPVLGQPSAIAGLLRLDWGTVDRAYDGNFLETAILLLALLVAIGLFWLDRTEPAYGWLVVICVLVLSLYAQATLEGYTTWISRNASLLLDAVLLPAYIGLWILFWATWFRQKGMAGLHRIVWGLAALLVLGTAMVRAPLYGSVVPAHAIVWISPLVLALKLLLGGLLIWVTARGIRQNRTEGLLALPAVLLIALYLYFDELNVLHVPVFYHPFGIAIGLGQIGAILSLMIVTVLLLRRFLRGQREREQWKLEIEQARQVQQMLIPEALPVVPGFTLESEYRPAQQVGGDFFQIIPHSADGSILIVLGDVSGKGLKAAMLVSLIVGSIRMVAETTQEPMAILQALNRRLCGRMQGHFATCVVTHIAANGETTLANAGHLAPYLNGKEIAIAGSLPLGIIEAAEFSRTDLRLCENDRLTFMTDGVVEAQNEQKELFGFERAQQIGNQPAAVIAEAAQKFGQEDDITVVSVVRASA